MGYLAARGGAAWVTGFGPASLLVLLGCAGASAAPGAGTGRDASPGDSAPDACSTDGDAGAGEVDAAFVLPAPSGSSAVGRGVHLLVDPSRPDPYATMPGAKRTFVVETFYPSEPCTSAPLARYAAPAVSDLLSHVFAFPPGFAVRVRSRGRLGAPFVADGATHPVLLLSHGLGVPRELYTTFAEDLASRGYVVASVSHTYDGGVVVLPDGTVVADRPFFDDAGAYSDTAMAAHLATWIDDERFTLDQLATWQASDALLRGRLDLAHAGALGHSYGGASAVAMCAQDARVSACADLDGTIWGANAGAFHARAPVLLVSSPDTLQDPTFTAVFDGSPVASRWLMLASAGHWNDSDLVVLMNAFGVPPAAAGAGAGDIGSIDAARALRVVDAYLAAFFDLYLRGKPTTLLDGVSPDYPEVTFINRSP